MKKSVLLTCALLTLLLFVGCSNNYVEQYETLGEITIARLDSVSTVEQYNAVVGDFTASTEELRAKYGEENFSQAELDLLQELSARVAAKFFDVQAQLPLAHPEYVHD